MPTDYGSESVVFPFYTDETRNSVSCEDFIGKTCKRSFENGTIKRAHKKKYCDVLENYENCPHYQEVYKKYI